MTIIAVSSFKGGTAKTSTCLHLGAGLAKYHQKRVLLIDFDAQANLTSGLGYDADSLESMAVVLQQEKGMEQVIHATPTHGLDLVAADIWLERVEVTGRLAADRYSHERLRESLRSVKGYDFILIDTPPSLCWLTESALIAAHHVLICATAEFYSVKGLQRLALFLQGLHERHQLDILGVLLSFWNTRGKHNATFLELIEEYFPGHLLRSRIRRDASISEAAIQGRPVYDSSPQSRGSEDLRQLCDEILTRLSTL